MQEFYSSSVVLLPDTVQVQDDLIRQIPLMSSIAIILQYR